MLALEGIRVLDLSRLAPGPYCSMLLADLGADVLLVEEPAGTGSRLTGQAARRLLERDISERAMAFNALSRNKRSIALDLKNEAARQVFYKLAERADVVLEGFRPGVVKRLGVDYDTLSQINPRIVYCSLSGYGQNGPYANLVGHDINYISIGGALGVIGWPGTPPAIPMNIIADFAGGGLYAAFAILTAIIAR
jgi:alpha-methylacyl-CoA racemase